MSKVVIIYTSEEARFNYKNNYKHYKLATFWLDIISKVNFRLLIVMSYITSKLRLRNV